MKSWKTTLTGLFAGVAIFIGSAIQTKQANPSAPPVTVGNVLPAVAVAILGTLAKDYDKSNAPNPAPTQKVDTES